MSIKFCTYPIEPTAMEVASTDSLRTLPSSITTLKNTIQLLRDEKLFILNEKIHLEERAKLFSNVAV
ncbi:hypothetical protein AQULUS_24290 (plasmid) [Aquicella lusitana]|uniref:Uncharacterized protein n=1 Tax=Aquicella lusitana TaxID=254246 RepID=A0A370GD41_9COXI|nr:hypothetical protein C8D86_12138 [Aquicella lusitana]VVC74663.1 hypothetical protein AQULUS_24290 [Aquicella lusitana]